MNISSLFEKRLERVNLQKTAIVLLKADGTEEKYSWYNYQEKAMCVAEWLSKQGIKRGDFVAIIPLNLPDSFFALLGIILIGAVPVPINVQLLKEKGLVDLRKIIDDCKPKLVLANESLYELMPEIDPYLIEGIIARTELLLLKSNKPRSYYYRFYTAMGENDLLIMPYTSGTSGQPKGVMLTQKNILNRLEAITAALEATEEERILSYLPLGHIAELVATFFGQIYAGYTVYFTEHVKEAIKNPEKLRKNFPIVLQQVKPTIFIGVPKIWTSFRKSIEAQIKKLPMHGLIIPQWLKKRAIKKKLGFRKTRIFVSAAAKISGDDLEFFDKLGIRVDDIYGQTETAGPLTFNGVPLGPNNKMCVKEEEIVVVGDCVMAGYFQNPSANEQVFSKNEVGEVIYHTGDTCRKDGEKIFWTGRLGNGFKLANGEYVNPEKIEFIEEEIRKIDPRINEAVICGVNRPHLVALIFIDGNSEFRELSEKIKLRLPQVGEGIHKLKNFVLLNNTELEMTPTMKIKKNSLLKKFELTVNQMYRST
ncbi:MAG: AMP-binding protein [Candidatus Yanofskybacteria bacterium]|nr:AMP-binding protein [Candidatus Yanofskybacteria bacterium]